MVFSKYGSCNCRVRPLALFLFNPTDRLPAINVRSYFESTDAARTALIAFADMRAIGRGRSVRFCCALHSFL